MQIKQENLFSLVKKFYQEHGINPNDSIDGNKAAARIVLFAQWAEKQRVNKTDTWLKIFKSQNTEEVFNWEAI